MRFRVTAAYPVASPPLERREALMVNYAKVVRWAEDYRNAWEAADVEAVASLFTDDAIYRSDIYQEPHAGRRGVADYWSDVTSTQANVTVLMGEPLVAGERADIEFWTTMTSGGEAVTLAGCLILNFDDSGKCRALREYWNFTSGTQHPPAGWGRLDGQSKSQSAEFA